MEQADAEADEFFSTVPVKKKKLGAMRTLLVPVTIYADEAVKLEHVSVVFTTPQGNVLIRQSGKVKLKGDDT